MYKFEYTRPDVNGAVIFTREQALVELRELKPYTAYIQIRDETDSRENQGAVFVAVTLDDATYDDWFTFSSEALEDYEAAEAFVKEAGCESLLEE